MKKDKQIRSDLIFKKELDEMKLEIIKNGKMRFMPSDRRLTKAIRRHTYWKQIKDDIVNAELEDDRWKNE